MPSLRLYKLFISHAWRYSDDYLRMVGLLNDAPNFQYYNYSVPKHDPLIVNNTAKLSEELRQQIRPVQAVVIIAGMYANYSGWIQFEMDYARQLGKPMIGVRPYGGERIPVAVVNSVDEMVNWSTVSVVDAIRRHAL